MIISFSIIEILSIQKNPIINLAGELFSLLLYFKIQNTMKLPIKYLNEKGQLDDGETSQLRYVYTRWRN